MPNLAIWPNQARQWFPGSTQLSHQCSCTLWNPHCFKRLYTIAVSRAALSYWIQPVPPIKYARLTPPHSMWLASQSRTVCGTCSTCAPTVWLSYGHGKVVHSVGQRHRLPGVYMALRHHTLPRHYNGPPTCLHIVISGLPQRRLWSSLLPVVQHLATERFLWLPHAPGTLCRPRCEQSSHWRRSGAA